MILSRLQWNVDNVAIMSKNILPYSLKKIKSHELSKYLRIKHRTYIPLIIQIIKKSTHVYFLHIHL